MADLLESVRAARVATIPEEPHPPYGRAERTDTKSGT